MLLKFLQPLLHYGFHFLLPVFFAYLIDKEKLKVNYLLLLATMLVDIDHLLSTPFFSPCRCSIGYHPLHTIFPILCYFLMLFNSKFRIFGIGLLWHMITDWIDCQFIKSLCH